MKYERRRLRALLPNAAENSSFIRMPFERVALPAAAFINARQLQETFIRPIALRMGTYGVAISADVKGKGMTSYGYARVSTRDQNVSRQIDALRAFPLEEHRIFVDHYSGAHFERPNYQLLMGTMGPHDVLVVTSIDRLGRNYKEILEQWQELTKRREIDIVVLDMPLLDTRSTDRDLTGTFIADMMLQLLSYVAQVERENIRQRQAEGIAAARVRGVRLGRPPLPKPKEYWTIKELVGGGELTHAEAAMRLGVSRTTFEKWLREDR